MGLCWVLTSHVPQAGEAGCSAKNAVILLTWTTVVGCSAFFVAFFTPLNFILRVVEPGLRPEPAREPPLRPFTPAMRRFRFWCPMVGKTWARGDGFISMYTSNGPSHRIRI